MKAFAIWLGCAAPWLVAVSLIALFGVTAYQDGYHFVAGLHAFGWLGQLYCGAMLYVPALLISAAVLIAARRRLRLQGKLGFAVLLAGTSVVAPIVAMPVIQSCFFRGRDAAYRQLDYPAIYAACGELSRRAEQEAAPFSYAEWEEDSGRRLAQLPETLSRLAPLQVHATQSAVFIQMDGGGPMYHEGIGVVTADNLTEQLGLEGEIYRLDPDLPVYLYRLYDYRIFLNRVEELQRSEPARPADRSRRGRPDGRGRR